MLTLKDDTTGIDAIWRECPGAAIHETILNEAHTVVGPYEFCSLLLQGEDEDFFDIPVDYLYGALLNHNGVFAYARCGQIVTYSYDYRYHDFYIEDARHQSYFVESDEIEMEDFVTVGYQKTILPCYTDIKPYEIKMSLNDGHLTYDDIGTKQLASGVTIDAFHEMNRLEADSVVLNTNKQLVFKKGDKVWTT